MRASAFVVAGMIGLACCVISLINARSQALLGAEGTETVHAPEATQAALPHLMRGWARTPPKEMWWPAGP